MSHFAFRPWQAIRTAQTNQCQVYIKEKLADLNGVYLLVLSFPHTLLQISALTQSKTRNDRHN